MPQSLSKIYVHLAFSTKNRERVLLDNIRPDLHAYMGGILKKMDCIPVEINTVPDHTHLLLILRRTIAMSDLVSVLKRNTTDWLRGRGHPYRKFQWQAGFGAFSVSQSAVEEVREYIRNQQEHHRVKTFQDEYLAFLRKYQINFDERYVWD